jgi:rhodanese-related sulfurtransferase
MQALVRGTRGLYRLASAASKQHKLVVGALVASKASSRASKYENRIQIQSISKPKIFTTFTRSYSTSNNDELKVITKKELENKIQSSPNDFYLIDVREPHETAQGIIPTAKLVPLGHVFAALTTPDLDWEDAFGFPKPELDDEVIFYCRSGKRSYQACMLAKQFGYKNIKNYEGSWLEWSGQS